MLIFHEYCLEAFIKNTDFIVFSTQFSVFRMILKVEALWLRVKSFFEY